LPENNHIALQVNELLIGYQKSKPVLSNLNLNFSQGQITGLVAKNGSGKSTLIKTLCGVLPALSGSIFINGININNFNKKDLAKKSSLVLTDKPTLNGFKVKDLVAMGRYPYASFLGKLNSVDEECIESAITLCKINHLKEKYCNELSDGEFQKAMLARAIAQETSLLFLDEPTAFLDFPSKLNLMKLLNDLSTLKNTSIIIASHDLELLKEHTHQLLVLKKNGAYSVIESKSITIDELVNELDV
jgi:iron complex transport system ATP-binding protein